jgi:hypothetical protein
MNAGPQNKKRMSHTQKKNECAVTTTTKKRMSHKKNQCAVTATVALIGEGIRQAVSGVVSVGAVRLWWRGEGQYVGRVRERESDA